MDEVTLPAIIESNAAVINQLTDALGVSREILASDDEIQRAWGVLPRLISQIPLEVRSALHARMCVAVSTGLFDAAVNYAWNSAIVALRDKVRGFGLHVIPQIIEKDFNEKILLDVTDAELIQLCLSLNLISEDAFFFLDQCRDVRNNFSAAHPPIGTLDDAEFIVFLTRCIKYALSTTSNPRGVDTQALIESVKELEHSGEQTQEWVERINSTYEAQQELIISMLHGIYCDLSSSQETRLNVLNICAGLAPKFSQSTKSELINRHSDYVVNGKTDQQALSMKYFESLGMLALLSEQERHFLVTKACKKLLAVHREWLNFYNEPPFAERLLEISRQAPIPNTARGDFVVAVVNCAVGNQYGVSNAAFPSYVAMIKNFSQREIAVMLDIPKSSTIAGMRVKTHLACMTRYKGLVKLLSPVSIPTTYASLYKSFTTT